MAKKLFQSLEQSLRAPEIARAKENAAYGSAKSKPFPKNKTQMWVILADLHVPEHDRPSVAAVFDFIDRNRKLIHGVILLGDQANMECISRHTVGLPGLRKSGGFQEEIDILDREIMQPIEKMLPKATKVFLQGNHDGGWLDLFLEKSPEFKGCLSWPRLLRLDERGWINVPQGETFSIGPLVTMHGDQLSTGVNTAKKAVEAFCSSTLSGHIHQYTAATKCSQVKQRDRWVSITLPCLTTLSPGYGKGKPNAHTRGFGIVESFWGGKLFNVYVPIISEGKFCFGGKVYGR
jgi:hypothetical protein